MTAIDKINATQANRKALREHAREAMEDYSRVMTWLLIDDDGDLYEITEPQGQSFYSGSDTVLATTGDFYKAHGNGAACDQNGTKYKTQREYLSDLLGKTEYIRIFNK